MEITTITTPSLGINTYLVWDPASKLGAVIDPTRDIQPILQAIGHAGCKITHILETHVHADFASGSKELKDHLDGRPLICCSSMGGKEWTPQYADILANNLLEIPFGNMSLTCIHTPGHTPEHVSWIAKENSAPIACFTGDFLFIGSVGRPDLLGTPQTHELASQLYHSVFNILPSLPEKLAIYPAHGAGSLCGKDIQSKPTSTLDHERIHNLFLIPAPKDKWIGQLMENMPRIPHYFPIMKKLNVKGAGLTKDIPEPQKYDIPPKNAFLLDVRPITEFASAHDKHAVNIPVDGAFLKWAPEIVPYDLPIFIIAKDPSELNKAIRQLRVVGLDNVMGYSFGPSGSEILQLIDFEAIKDNLGNYTLIDVRTLPEFEGKHLEKALRFELPFLADSLNSIPRNKPIVTICGTGFRASIAASILQKAGFDDVSLLKRGMQSVT